MRASRLAAISIALAAMSACGLDEEGMARPSATGGAAAKAGAASGGNPNGGSWTSGSAGNSGASSAGNSGTSGAAAGEQDAGSDAVDGSAGASGGSAGAEGGGAGSTGLDCTTLFASIPNIYLCPDSPFGQCLVAFGVKLGALQGCGDVCTSAGLTCVRALDDLADTLCVLPPVDVPLECTYTPNEAVCICSA